MDLNLADKKVAITGGSRGIGKAIAECFAKEGANVSICARNKKDVDSALSDLRKFGKKYAGYAVDIQKKLQVEKWMRDTAADLGGIDILILNASALSTSWDAAVNVDLWGTIHCVEAALPYLRKSSSAAIVYVGSIAASVAVPEAAPYCAIKAAMANYMKSLSRALSVNGIRVNTVSPGNTYFEGGYWANEKKERPEIFKTVEAANDLKRMAEPAEIANCVVFLSSSRASYVLGSNLLVDGGSARHVVL
ncbi:MAG: SDR family oxidoreductase [Ferruginibacter sp.]